MSISILHIFNNRRVSKKYAIKYDSRTGEMTSGFGYKFCDSCKVNHRFSFNHFSKKWELSCKSW